MCGPSSGKRPTSLSAAIGPPRAGLSSGGGSTTTTRATDPLSAPGATSAKPAGASIPVEGEIGGSRARRRDRHGPGLWRSAPSSESRSSMTSPGGLRAEWRPAARLGESEDAYFAWLTDSSFAGGSYLSFTSAGIVNEIPPVTDSEALTSAAGRARFVSFARWSLPDDRDVLASSAVTLTCAVRNSQQRLLKDDRPLASPTWVIV
jgi:hypothetical protein